MMTDEEMVAEIEVEMNRLRNQDISDGFSADRLDYRHIAARVLEERERCAKVAERMDSVDDTHGWAGAIADAIRKSPRAH